MLRTVKRLIALSLPTQREQLEQRTKLTWPRPFLLRPLFLRFLVYETGPSISKRVQVWGCIRDRELPSILIHPSLRSHFAAEPYDQHA